MIFSDCCLLSLDMSKTETSEQKFLKSSKGKVEMDKDKNEEEGENPHIYVNSRHE